MFWLGLGIGVAGGGAAIWFTKDWILRTAKGTAQFASDLEAQVSDLRQRLR